LTDYGCIESRQKERYRREKRAERCNNESSSAIKG